MKNDVRTHIDPEKFAYQALSTIHFHETDDYERQNKERLAVFLMLKYLADDFNDLENKAFDISNNNDDQLSKLGFDDLLSRINQLNKY
ncbi:hypothetical protein [Lentilactobacillus sunkii]|jgi:hypothetical protein|uniref:Uncharacterized protein n=2 Tax=Lentilactobacillus sunkii TaxID=481719 RepID=A0A0R1L8B7_9LACO|nr:hypothetical protein [Lentilactobacillus sunkii]KRK88682.1 hypothetical protein FD17_GL002374 [Lentilactobacillus sunkii DSM 19904]OFA13069.1 hypothetical protein LASUN_00680 [Lentilactobacillus sunkii]